MCMLQFGPWRHLGRARRRVYRRRRLPVRKPFSDRFGLPTGSGRPQKSRADPVLPLPGLAVECFADSKPQPPSSKDHAGQRIPLGAASSLHSGLQGWPL